MRKYFLLGAVALLATTSANATTDYAEVTAKATIEVAGTFECDDIDYGTIVVKQGNEQISIGTADGCNDVNDTWDLISASCTSVSPKCTHIEAHNSGTDYNIELSNANGDKIDLEVYDAIDQLSTMLHIPANVKPGDYTSSFTLTRTY
ncbi:MAG: hypothetical protein E7016_07630 [Alphaproteobacteria bacterium]|nr:hypothetical protein [Alphaproteobacteria bacterium]